MLSKLMLWASARPALQIYGKGQGEADWRLIHVLATARRNRESRWPIFGGTCITWSSRIIAVGWDFAEWLLREQLVSPASRDQPLEVGGGRLHHAERRSRAGTPSFPLASEIMAHECGHTCQARRFGLAYLPVGAAFTWWREGCRWWNWFENQASELGLFGGIVTGSVHPTLWAAVRSVDGPEGVAS